MFIELFVSCVCRCIIQLYIYELWIIQRSVEASTRLNKNKCRRPGSGQKLIETRLINSRKRTVFLIAVSSCCAGLERPVRISRAWNNFFDLIIRYSFSRFWFRFGVPMWIFFRFSISISVFYGFFSVFKTSVDYRFQPLRISKHRRTKCGDFFL